jgi:hypothetical protein
MNNVSSNGRAVLRGCVNDKPAEQILRCRKIIVPLEANPEEISHRIVQDLRTTLRRILKGEVVASSEEVEAAGALLLRVKALDPRRAKRLEDKKDEGEHENKPENKPEASEPNNLSGNRLLVDSYVPKVLTEQWWADLANRCR